MSCRKLKIFFVIFLNILLINTCSSISEVVDNKINGNSPALNHNNFLIIDRLNDNEIETRIKWNDLMGKETTLDAVESDRFANSSIKLTSLWQLTNGKNFAQLIFNGKNLLDCEFMEDGGNFVSEFIDKFIGEFDYIRKEKLTDTKHAKHHQYHEDANINKELQEIKPNAKFIQLKRLQDIPENLLEMMNLNKLKKKCNQLHRQIRQKLRHKNGDKEEDLSIQEEEEKNESESMKRSKRQTDSWFLAPNSKWCGDGSAADSYKQLGGNPADQCCRKHDHCKMNIPALHTRYGLFNMRPFTISHCKCDRRRTRRDLSSYFIIPYTKYCGVGWTATKYSEIGAFSKTDKCCRAHDYCTHWIASFEKKWSLFNWNMYTMMDCKCDKRFRTCLKMADSSDANIVGKLFFNIVQTKCFVLKPEKTCILYSWWGKCLKFKTKKRAYMRDNQKY